MSIKDLLSELSKRKQIEQNRDSWHESAPFRQTSDILFKQVVLPTVGEVVDDFNKAGYLCVNKQMLHPIVHGPNNHHLFFSATVGSGTMQVDIYVNHLTERIVVEASFSNTMGRSIDFSVAELDKGSLNNILEDYTTEFLRHLK